MKYCMGCMEEIQENMPTCPHCGFEQAAQNPAGLLPVGTVLQGRYIVGKSIGNGGFGVTYIGLDSQLKRKIAIKEFFPNTLARRVDAGVDVTVSNQEDATRFQNGLDQFLAEAKHLASLSNIPGIVYIYNYFHDNGTGYIVMEYLEGTDLRNLLEKQGGIIPYEEARELILSVLYILRNVHENGILHRDIAPDNIFITTDKVVKLIDFGAARHATRGADDSAEILLKIGYAPVEQYSLDGEQGTWTDMYEVGALFYRMITGTKPMASIDRAKEDTLPIPSEIGIQLPPEGEAAIMTSLNVESLYRIQNARDYMEALGGLDFQLTEWTVHNTVVEDDVVEKSGFFTNKRLALLAVACALILVVGFVMSRKVKEEANVPVVATNMQMQDLAGMSEAQAKAALNEAGIDGVTVRYLYDENANEEVRSQNPEKGTSISADVEVVLTVASKQYTTLPELEKGKSYEEIESELVGKGIVISRVEIYSDAEAKGAVIGYHERAAGEVITVSDTIEVEVSLGKESDYEVEVPALCGMTAKKAQEKCDELGIPMEKIDGDKKDYVVKTQSVDAGQKINTRDEKITLELEKPAVEKKQESSSPKSSSKPKSSAKETSTKVKSNRESSDMDEEIAVKKSNSTSTKKTNKKSTKKKATKKKSSSVSSNMTEETTTKKKSTSKTTKKKSSSTTNTMTDETNTKKKTSKKKSSSTTKKKSSKKKSNIATESF